ncbi:MAG: tryptophan synthase subunit alpha [Ilumatobacteraceae bacterium]
MIDLEERFRTLRASGRKLLVPYVTGFAPSWVEAIHAAVANGADAIEIGLPFSDPVMDGPVIQRASTIALQRGATVNAILDEVRELDVDVPLVVMCYYNTVFRAGHERFASLVRKAGVSGVIVPDLPLEESAPWCAAADTAGLATVMLAAPTAPDARLPLIAQRSRGFVYAVGLLGITGERETLASSATTIARRVKNATDLPVLVGVGVSDAAQAVEACSVADGVIQGAAIMRRLLDEGADSVGKFVADVRRALDE